MGTARRERARTATWSGATPAFHDLPGYVPANDVVPGNMGPYRLLRVLGEGGTARVYEAEHSIIGKRVALKTLLPQFVLCREAREMLVREARVAVAIEHPHLIQVYDYGVDDYGRPYCVMELASGQTLSERLSDGPLPLSRCLDLCIRIADAVAAIHSAGFLHRDIKADNVLLVSDGRRLQPKLIDFGIARTLDPSGGDEREGMVGTPRTMAPEQISQDEVDERTDIWALGVLFYEMLAGHLPFPIGGSVREDLVAIVTEPPHPLPLSLSDDVRALVEECLNKEPDGRPASAALVVKRLRRALADYIARHRAIERILER